MMFACTYTSSDVKAQPIRNNCAFELNTSYMVLMRTSASGSSFAVG
jgi:hypothetical protein